MACLRGQNNIYEEIDSLSVSNPITMAEIMAQAVPGCFMSLGVRGADWKRPFMVHTPTFRVDESALPIGTASLVAAAIEWMQQKG